MVLTTCASNRICCILSVYECPISFIVNCLVIFLAVPSSCLINVCLAGRKCAMLLRDSVAGHHHVIELCSIFLSCKVHFDKWRPWRRRCSSHRHFSSSPFDKHIKCGRMSGAVGAQVASFIWPAPPTHFISSQGGQRSLHLQLEIKCERLIELVLHYSAAHALLQGRLYIVRFTVRALYEK